MGLNSQIFLRQFDTKYNKIASAMIVDLKFLSLSQKRKHTFISTGMSSFEDIKNAVDIFKKSNCSFELMHTVSTYPLKTENLNLRMIETLRININVMWDIVGMNLELQSLMLRHLLEYLR